MGSRISLAYPRTAVALVLTIAAVAVPCGAWFVAGQHQVEREAHSIAKNLYGKGLRQAVVHAEHLATRFEVLREAESRRPFYHYQNLFHDPKAASQGLSVAISPLAQSSADPLIDAHFQVDEKGQLSLPTLNETFPELGLQHGDEAQCELLWKLKDVVVFCQIEADTGGFALDPSELFSEGLGIDSEFDEDALPLAHPFDSDLFDDVALSREPMGRAAEPEVQWLTSASWRQHLAANDLYEDLKFKKTQDPGAPTPTLNKQDRKPVRISTSPMEWRTLPVGGLPTLVAIRTVETPAGAWTQGFSVATETVSSALDGSPFPAFFEPGIPQQRKARESGSIMVQIDGTPWQVRVDIGPSLADAEATHASSKADFLGTFLLGALGAGLAGLLLVAMVFHSERLAQQRAQFAAAAAHELRTPLAGLRLYGEMLAEGFGNPARSQEYARRMAGEAERLGRVVTNVLSFTRLERGGFTVHPEMGELQIAVLEAYERQRPALEESGARVDLEIDPELPAVQFDRDAVTHIVQNLLDNAEKYTRDIEDRRIVIGLKQEIKQVVLSISDNGNGISKSLRRSLFRPFTRGGQSDAPEGLGLGLLLVRMLAHAQGARVTYRDSVLGGAEFLVAFPKQEPAAV